MNRSLKKPSPLLLVLALITLAPFSALQLRADETKVEITPEIVEEAYVWGLPIVVMYRYVESMAAKTDGINRLVHNRKLSEPGQFSGGPNRDTLYSFSWFDLTDEPIVVSLPDFKERYFVWQMTDMYANNFHNVGSHLLEGPAKRYRSGYKFMLAAPDWKGSPPKGVELVRCPVRFVNILYRIGTKGETEYGVVNKLQDDTLVIPLSKWNEGVRKSVQLRPSNPIPAYRDAIAYGTGVTGKDQRNPIFFSVLQDALEANAPYSKWDREFVEGPLAKLGVGPGKNFDFDSLDEKTQQLILDAQGRAFDRMMSQGQKSWGRRINGWQLGPPNHGNWDASFQDRAYATYIGGMWPVSNNSTYAMGYVDTEGRTLEGKFTYRMTIPADALPPVTSFWSVTAYDAGTTDLYPNDAKLYAVGSNHPNTVYADDGSVEIVFAHQIPKDLGKANWLPIPKTAAMIILRFYAPKPEVLDGKYDIPGLVRQKIKGERN